jgi:magnesium-transporting ATPase (P-type)
LSKWGIWAAFAIFAASLVHWITSLFVMSDQPFSQFAIKLIDDITQFFTIIMVAIPEGLPLTVTLSLAYSV